MTYNWKMFTIFITAGFPSMAEKSIPPMPPMPAAPAPCGTPTIRRKAFIICISKFIH